MASGRIRCAAAWPPSRRRLPWRRRAAALACSQIAPLSGGGLWAEAGGLDAAFGAPGFSDLASSRSPWAAGEAMSSSARRGDPVFPPYRRRTVVSSSDGKGCVRRCVGGGYDARSTSLWFFGAGGGVATPVALQLAALPSCGSGVAEDDDFPAALFVVDAVKVSPAQEERGGGGASSSRVGSSSELALQGPGCNFHVF